MILGCMSIGKVYSRVRGVWVLAAVEMGNGSGGYGCCCHKYGLPLCWGWVAVVMDAF